MLRLRSLGPLALVAVVLTAGGAVAAPSAPVLGDAEPPVVAADRPATGVIVQWRDGTDGPARDAVRRAVGLVRTGDLPLPRTEVAAVPRGQSAQALARRLSADPRVAFAEPDAWVQPSSDDPGFRFQWGLENTGQEIGFRPGVPGIDIGAVEAWALADARPGAAVTVAITDSGVDIRHPELADELHVKDSEPFNGLDDDGNGLVDDVVGWNYVTQSPIVYDDPVVDAHGTHVAGTVAATRNNNQGVAGATNRAELMAVKFIGPEGGATSDAIRAIDYASDNGALVINASWGGPDSSQALQQAIAASPAVVVAAAGNEGKDNDVAPEYPANYQLGNLISVAAINNVGDLADFSNRGRLSVDVAAPGADIGSTVPNGGYDVFNGTSMAAPHVAATAALIRSLRPDLTAGEVVSLLKNTVQPLESLRLTTSTGGLIDMEAAVRGALAGAEPASEPDVLLPVLLPPNGDSDQAQPEDACPDGIPSAAFADVVDNVHADAIDCGVWYELIRGTSPTTYTPALAVNRGQTASLLAGLVARAGRLPDSAPDAFTDDQGSVHESNIDKLASLGIIKGVAADRFAPDRPVTRGQVATLLVGVQEFLTGSELPRSVTPFTDIAFDTHRESIEKAYTAGLVRGTSAITYSPAGTTRRDQAASLIVRELQVLVDAGIVASKSF